MLDIYTLAFCRAVTGLVFVISFLRKVRDLSVFERTILRFRLLPAWMNRAAAFLFLSGEGTVVILLIAGREYSLLGFALAAMLLAVFSIGLMSALAKGLHSPCNCFGRTERPISGYDLVRNTLLILCALSGLGANLLAYTHNDSLEFSAWLLIGLGACAFTIIVIRLGMIIPLFYHRWAATTNRLEGNK